MGEVYRDRQRSEAVGGHQSTTGLTWRRAVCRLLSS
jgi:hypothetical protein